MVFSSAAQVRIVPYGFTFRAWFATLYKKCFRRWKCLFVATNRRNFTKRKNGIYKIFDSSRCHNRRIKLDTVPNIESQGWKITWGGEKSEFYSYFYFIRKRFHFGVIFSGKNDDIVSPTSMNPCEDIIGNPVNLIGSGPTIAPQRDQNHLPQLISKFKILDYPNEIINNIFSTANGARETDISKIQCSHEIIGENKIMLRLVFHWNPPFWLAGENNIFEKPWKVKLQNWPRKMDFDQS